MIKWALIVAAISVVVGVFGFSAISAGTAAIAMAFFLIAVAIFVIFLVMTVFAGRKLAQ